MIWITIVLVTIFCCYLLGFNSVTYTEEEKKQELYEQQKYLQEWREKHDNTRKD